MLEKTIDTRKAWTVDVILFCYLSKTTLFFRLLSKLELKIGLLLVS
jgi:hypothetical protein